MATGDKVTLEAEIKSNIKQVTKETKELTNEMGAFGITIGSIKQKFSDMSKIVMNGLKQISLNAKLAGVGLKTMFSGGIIKGAKTLFLVIKRGIASTGIGLLVVAFGSLVTAFTKSKKGAEALKVVFAGIGATVRVLIDRASKFGNAIIKLFKKDTKGALEDMKGAFKDIGTEIVEDTKNAIALQTQLNALKNSERDLRVETAQRRAEIERLKLIAEDTTKSEEERLEAAKDAFKLEKDLLDKRVANAEEAVRIQKAQMKDRIADEEDLNKLADLEVNLANIKAESTTKQIELNNKINAIEKEGATKRQEAIDKENEKLQEEADKLQEIIDLETERLNQLQTTATETIDAYYNNLLSKEDQEKNAVIDKYFTLLNSAELSTEQLKELKEAEQFELTAIENKYSEERKKNSKAETDAKIANRLEEIDAYAGLGKALLGLAGESKELSIATAIIDTFVGANKAIAQGGPLAFPVAATVIASGLANVKKIMEQDTGSGGGGGGSVSATTPALPAPEMMSGSFELTGGVKPEPVQAFVVSDDVTNNQDKLAAIRRRATI